MKETDEFLLFIEKMAEIGVFVDKECRREWLTNFTNAELKSFMIKLFKEMLYFIDKPFDFLGRGRVFEKLNVKFETDVFFCRYKYKGNSKKNLRSIFSLIRVNNEYKVIFLHTFLEDGDKKKSTGSGSYKQAILIATKRFKDKYEVEGDE